MGLAAVLSDAGCRGGGDPPTMPSDAPPAASDVVNSDQALFRFVTVTQPFGSYPRFPNVDVLGSGSSAHVPFVRVSMNATAFAALQNGRLPAGTQFPNGSVIFKEVLPSQSGSASVYAVMYKDRGNPLAGDGWLWSELRPDGSVVYAVTDRGRACTGCHSLEQGLQNDLVRTFERQR
jgi:hypothetical protein